MMGSDEVARSQQAFHELNGAIAAIKTLREMLELRLGEARDDCVQEVLDNIIALVSAEEVEYQRRRNKLPSKPDNGSVE